MTFPSGRGILFSFPLSNMYNLPGPSMNVCSASTPLTVEEILEIYMTQTLMNELVKFREFKKEQDDSPLAEENITDQIKCVIHIFSEKM